VGEQMEEINRRGIQLCREAREAAAAHSVVVGGSMSAVPIFVSRDLPADPHARRAALLDKYRRHAFILAEAGAEVLAVEMIITPEEGSAATRPTNAMKPLGGREPGGLPDLADDPDAAVSVSIPRRHRRRAISPAHGPLVAASSSARSSRSIRALMRSSACG
jgi:Homocysteine S-methyltransferase